MKNLQVSAKGKHIVANIWYTVNMTNNVIGVPLQKGMTCTHANLVLRMTPSSDDLFNNPQDNGKCNIANDW